MASKDGFLTVVDSELKYPKSYQINYGMKTSEILVTDTAVCSSLGVVLVATSNCDLLLCSLAAGRCDISLRVVQFPQTITYLHVWSEPSKNEKVTIFCGDSSGGLVVIRLYQASSKGFLQNNDYVENNRIKCEHLFNFTPNFMIVQYYTALHKNWITGVRYIPHMDVFVTSARDDKVGARITHLQGKKEDVLFRVFRGVTCLDFCFKRTTLVTGCGDLTVKLWNPQIPQKPTAILKGHVCSIQLVGVNDVEDYVLSVALDKSVRVHSMNDHTCLQTLVSTCRLPGGLFESMHLNVATGQLFLGSKFIALYNRNIGAIETKANEKTSHSQAVCAVLYNPVFNYVVSADINSSVSVWDFETGKLQMQFSGCHTRSQPGDTAIVEITSLAFDVSYRRLITAAADGSVKIWNFNNGALLRECQAIDATEVTQIISTTSKILVAGWGRRIIQHMDTRDETETRPWDLKHADDITGMVLYDPFVVTSSF